MFQSTFTEFRTFASFVLGIEDRRMVSDVTFVCGHSVDTSPSSLFFLWIFVPHETQYHHSRYYATR